MNAVARGLRPKSAVASRKRGRRGRTRSPLRRPNENSHAGREDRTPEQIRMKSPGKKKLPRQAHAREVLCDCKTVFVLRVASPPFFLPQETCRLMCPNTRDEM